MMTKSIEMSEDAFIALLELAQCCGQNLLPQNPRKGNEAMQSFLKGREELILKGFVELDFDGTVSQTVWFARMIYSLTRTRSSMKIELDKELFWYLRGPIEQLFIKKETGNYVLTRCSAGEIFRLFRERLYEAASGRVITQWDQLRKDTILSDTQPVQLERSEKLAEHLYVYFDKEVPHA